MSEQPTSAPTASAIGPCPTISQISRTPPALEVYAAPSHHPTTPLVDCYCHCVSAVGLLLLSLCVGRCEASVSILFFVMIRFTLFECVILISLAYSLFSKDLTFPNRFSFSTNILFTDILLCGGRTASPHTSS